MGSDMMTKYENWVVKFNVSNPKVEKVKARTIHEAIAKVKKKHPDFSSLNEAYNEKYRKR
jgi:hypothetical protein